MLGVAESPVANEVGSGLATWSGRPWLRAIAPLIENLLRTWRRAATERRWGGLAAWAVQATFWVVFLLSNWKRWKQET